MRCACFSLQDSCMVLPYELQHSFLIRCSEKRFFFEKLTFPVSFVPLMPICGVDFLFRNIQECGYRGERYMLGGVKHEQYRLTHDKDWDLACQSETFLCYMDAVAVTVVCGSERGRSQSLLEPCISKTQPLY